MSNPLLDLLLRLLVFPIAPQLQDLLPLLQDPQPNIGEKLIEQYFFFQEKISIESFSSNNMASSHDPCDFKLKLGHASMCHCAIIVGDLPDRQGPGSHTEVPTTPSQMSIIHLTRVVGTLVP